MIKVHLDDNEYRIDSDALRVGLEALAPRLVEALGFYRLPRPIRVTVRTGLDLMLTALGANIQKRHNEEYVVTVLKDSMSKIVNYLLEGSEWRVETFRPDNETYTNIIGVATVSDNGTNNATNTAEANVGHAFTGATERLTNIPTRPLVDSRNNGQRKDDVYSGTD